MRILQLIATGIMLAILLVFFYPRAAVAQGRTGEIVFVETDVALHRDGTAVVAYTVQWRVIGERMRGFLFSGNDRLRVGAFSEKSHAVDDAGNTYGLQIKRLKPDVYEILLADGQARPRRSWKKL